MQLMKKYMKRITLTLGIILAVLASLVLIYTSDYYHASSEAQQYLTQTDNQIHITEQNGYISFLPENPVAGFIFFNAFAMATAGKICPPVPPPLMITLKLGRCKFCSSFFLFFFDLSAYT